VDCLKLFDWHAAIHELVVVEEIHLGVSAIETQSLVKRGDFITGEIDFGPRAKKPPVCETQIIVAEHFKCISELEIRGARSDFFWGVVFCPILAYAFAVGAELDPSGALVRLLSGGIAMTTALGPVVGDRLAEVFGYRGMGVATFAGSTVACLVLAILNTGDRGRWRRSDERE